MHTGQTTDNCHRQTNELSSPHLYTEGDISVGTEATSFRTRTVMKSSSDVDGPASVPSQLASLVTEHHQLVITIVPLIWSNNYKHQTYTCVRTCTSLPKTHIRDR